MTEKQRVTGNALVQPRALKTREKIILAAISVYSEKGYHNTTVDEIAKSAGLSVGTAYRYFKDKKELLLEALKYGFEHITEFADVSEDDIFGTNLERALRNFEKIHTDYFNIHEELEGLRHTDKDVRRLYDDIAESAIKAVHERLPEEIKNRPHSLQNLRIAIGLMENHCHYCMHNNPDKKTVKYLRERTVELAGLIIKG